MRHLYERNNISGWGVGRSVHERPTNKMFNIIYTLGSIKNVNGDFGVINQPDTKTKNNFESWKIATSRGSKAVLFLTMSLFEFEEGCPYDYIQVIIDDILFIL